ncbi:Protein SABRE [Pestalotiopsis sp. IQ-011]
MSASTGGTDLISCSNVTNTDTSYCCDHTNGCCDSGVSRFTVLPASPTTVATWNSTLSRYVQLSTSTSSSSTSTTTGTQSEKTTSGSSTATSSSTSGAASPTSSSSSSGLSTGAAAGIGVGGAVAAIAIAAAIFFLVRSHRKRRQPKGLELLGTTESKPAAAYGSPPLEAPDNVAPFRHEMGEPARIPPQELHGDSRMY